MEWMFDDEEGGLRSTTISMLRLLHFGAIASLSLRTNSSDRILPESLQMSSGDDVNVNGDKSPMEQQPIGEPPDISGGLKYGSMI